MTEWEKLCSGQLYNDFDEDLNRRRGLAKRCFRAYNRTQDEDVPERQRLMRQLFGAVGGDVKILGGVDIGDNTVIGAGSVVTKSIPANVIAVGSPCRVLRPITEKDKTGYTW